MSTTQPHGTRLALAATIGHIQLLPFGVRDRIVRLLARPEICPARPFTVDFFGQRYSGRLDSFIDWCVYMFGVYEPSVSEVMRRVARGGFATPPVVWDLGANCGHHVLLVARHAKAVHAFEPLPSLCESIAVKVRENDLRNVTIHQIGLGDTEGAVPFLPPLGGNLGDGSFYQPGLRDGEDIWRDGENLPTLPVTTGDAVVASGTEAPDMMKIDIQEYEYQALVGMQATLRAARPVIFLEYGRLLEQQTAGLRRGDELFGENYSWFLIGQGSGGFSLTPFDGAPPELQGTGFFVDIVGIPAERSERVHAALARA